MERGTDEELAAVHREWRALERERRLTTRLFVGVGLVLVSVVALLVLASVPFETCVYAHGLYAENCAVTDLTLLGQTLGTLVGVGGLAAGAWLSWHSVRGLWGNGDHA